MLSTNCFSVLSVLFFGGALFVSGPSNDGIHMASFLSRGPLLDISLNPKGYINPKP